MPHIEDTTVRAILKSQYRAALAMLTDAIEQFPEEHWLMKDHTNAAWQIAYHTLFFTEYYSRPDWRGFIPWLTHGIETQNNDGIPGPPDPNSDLPLIPEPFSKAEVLAYARYCDGMIESTLNAMDVLNEESGFYWYKVSKLEHQIINLRHMQHGTAQLADRLRAIADIGVAWAGARPAQVSAD